MKQWVGQDLNNKDSQLYKERQIGKLFIIIVILLILFVIIKGIIDIYNYIHHVPIIGGYVAGHVK